jgi:hypothetical protein|tara:strand:+ start:547 stop:918 length:372 start_codon:yes stop_codon:yes gene_type:complete
MAEEDPVRFGAEFGPKRTENSTGVSLSTFKNLVWISNLGGLLLCAIGLELIVVQQQAYWGLGAIIAGVIVALFPSNYEIVGMEAIQEGLEKDSGKQKREALDESENQQQWWNESEENLKDSNQ